MPISYAILMSVGICVIAAILEGLFSGNNVKPFLGKLHNPKYSPPLWAWVIIGICYYAICFVVLYRIFRSDDDTSIKYLPLTLILVVMIVNAFWNYVFFRLENLFYSFVLIIIYSLVVVALFICLIQLDKVAAFVLVPYLIYLIYVCGWSYGLLKLNPNLK